MQVSEFRQKIKPGIDLNIGGQKFNVRQVIKFRLDDGEFYMKCFLNDGYVIADDLDQNMFILVKELETQLREPFPENLNFEGHHFKFIYDAHAVAEEVLGEGFFKPGFSEKFWDYQADDGSYLSLGIHDKTGERQDLYGRIVTCEELDIQA